MRYFVVVEQTPPHRTSHDPPDRYHPRRDTTGIKGIPRNETQSATHAFTTTP